MLGNDPIPQPGHVDGTLLAEHDGVTFTLRGADALDLLEPLWLHLFDHHAEVGNGGIATVDRSLSWSRRKRIYERLFDEPGTFIVLAQRDHRPVGYAMGHIRPGPDDTWDTGDLIGEVETLVVVPELRGKGHGTVLLDAAEAELVDRGATSVAIAVLAGNERTQRFYERRGMRPTVTYLMRLGNDRA